MNADEFDRAEFERQNESLVRKASAWSRFDGVTYKMNPNILASQCISQLNDLWIRWKAHKIVERVEASR